MPKARRLNESVQPSINYSQPNNNILYVMMGVITLFLVFMIVRVISLEKKLGTASVGTASQVQKESPLSVPNLKKYAKELGLNIEKFNKCLDSGEKKTLVEKDTAYGSSLGVQGTPGFFINGQFLAGAFPFQFFKEIIDKQIAGTASADCTTYSTELQKYCSDPDPLKNAFFPATKEVETVLDINKKLAPVKIAVLPLVKNKEEITKTAKEIFDMLKVHFDCQYDESGSIGRRYRRQDEIGTPYCITVDFETLDNKDVTLRDRDTMKQERVKISELGGKIFNLLTS